MKSIFTYFLLLTCCRANGIFSRKREEVQTFIDSMNEKVKAAADVLDAEYVKIDKLKAKSEELEGLIKKQTETLTLLNQQEEQSRVQRNSLEQNNKKLIGENEKLESKKNELNIERRNEESKLNQISIEIKDNEDLKAKLIDEVRKLKEDEDSLKSTNMELDNEKKIQTEANIKLIKEKEKVAEEKEALDSTIFSLYRDQTQLRNDKATKENEISGLVEQINHKNTVIIDLDIKVMKVQENFDSLNQQRDELKKGNKKMLKDMCKEHYTFWNLDFLSNNKESVFTSFLMTILIGSSLPILIRFFNTKQSSELKSFNANKERFKEASASSLGHMSDDEDNSVMVPSSSKISKKELIYNYDRDSMELNEDPRGCLNHIQKKYRIKKDLNLHWETLKHGKSIEFNLWKVESGELLLTKLLIKKVIKEKKPLLTFELFQTKLKDGLSYSNWEETEIDEEDNRNEAKLAFRIHDTLPNFSV